MQLKVVDLEEEEAKVLKTLLKFAAIPLSHKLRQKNSSGSKQIIEK